MQTSILAIFGLVAAAMANPTYPGTTFTCSSLLYSQAQCCATDVGGVADLDCSSRMFKHLGLSSFRHLAS
jgi:hypothetical protein